VGWNNRGQLGDGTTNNRAIPVKVSGVSNVVAISAGSEHTVVLDSAATSGMGTQRLWPTRQRHQLRLYGAHRPNPVQSLISNVVAIAAGSGHTMALKSDGTVWGWGANVYGQIGNGKKYEGNSSPPRRTRRMYTWLPRCKSAIYGNVTEICARSQFTMALKRDGTVWIWGTGGGFPTDPAVTPQQVAISNVVAISAGGQFMRWRSRPTAVCGRGDGTR